MKQCSKAQASNRSATKALLSLFLLFSTAAAQAEIRAFKSEYDVKYLRVRAAEVTMVLAKDDKHTWTMSRDSRAVGFARFVTAGKQNLQEKSWFEISDGTLHPRKFLLEKPGAKKGRRRIEITFTDTQALVSTDDGQAKTYAKAEHSQDQVSAVMAVMLKMQSQQEDFSLPIMARRGENIASFKVLEDVSVKTPAGVFDTVHIVQKSKKRTTNYWLAKEHNMIPVKISHQEEDDEGAVMLLKKLSVRNQ